MQAQTTRWLREYRFSRGILGTVIGLGLVTASILGIQALTGGQTDSATQRLSPVKLVEEDPPLPANWVDSYFTDRPVVIPVEQDPPLPDGWIDPYFKQSAAEFAGAAAGLNTTTLNLDRDGADVIPVDEKQSSQELDLTVLFLDREGADSPTGNWLDMSYYAAAQVPSTHEGPDITGLNLDRDGADSVIE